MTYSKLSILLYKRDSNNPKANFFEFEFLQFSLSLISKSNLLINYVNY